MSVAEIQAAESTPLPLPPREGRVGVADGVDLAFLRWDGAGVPFLLVHGLASNARLWEGVGAALAAAGHPVVAVDLRGHGRSSRPDAGYDFATIAADLAALVSLLGLHRPILAGQSWGADVALETATRFPGLLRGIVLVDGGLVDLADRFPSWAACRERLAPPRLEGLPVARIESHLRAAHADWADWGIRAVLANFEVRPDGTITPRLSHEHHLAILRALWEHRPSELLPAVGSPVLVAPADTGDGDWTADKRAAADLAVRRADRVRVRWFAPADHDIHVQQPAALAGVLLAALADGFFPADPADPAEQADPADPARDPAR